MTRGWYLSPFPHVSKVGRHGLPAMESLLASRDRRNPRVCCLNWTEPGGRTMTPSGNSDEIDAIRRQLTAPVGGLPRMGRPHADEREQLPRRPGQRPGMTSTPTTNVGWCAGGAGRGWWRRRRGWRRGSGQRLSWRRVASQQHRETQSERPPCNSRCMRQFNVLLTICRSPTGLLVASVHPCTTRPCVS